MSFFGGQKFQKRKIDENLQILEPLKAFST